MEGVGDGGGGGDEDDDCVYYNPRTWLVAPSAAAAEGASGAPSLSSMMADLPALVKPQSPQQQQPIASLLPEHHPKYKVFIDEYRPSDAMAEIEHDFSNHIAAAYEWEEQQQQLASPFSSATPLSPSFSIGLSAGGAEFESEEKEPPPPSPLTDVYASRPYIVALGQERTAEEEEEMVKRRTDLARQKLARERGKYLVSGSELATVDTEVLLQAMLHPHEVQLPQPPLIVNALGKDGCASVWWQCADNFDQVPPEAGLTAWEVTRYRLDGDDWVNKGVTIVSEPHEIEQCRCEVLGVPNGGMYRFTVTGRNLRGRGFESCKSDAVLVDADLPPGWFRFWDETTGKLYYSNVKTRQSSWVRPDLDPFYLHEEIVLTFSEEERKNLREMFTECVGLQGRITAHAFKSLLLEMGEVMGIQRIGDYFFEFANAGRESIRRWDHFMLIMATIKRRRVHSREIGHFQSCLNYSCCLPCFAWENATCCTRYSFFLLLDNWTEEATERNKFGEWTREWSDVAQKEYYINTRTDERRWDAPREVRFYLPKPMEVKLQSMFTPREIDDFKIRYSQYDLDGSGNIDAVEFKMLLEGMGIRVSDRLRTRLINEIDLNRNGTIEFHEFAFLMMSLNNPNSTLKFLQKALPSPDKLRQAITGGGGGEGSEDVPGDDAGGAGKKTAVSTVPSCCLGIITTYSQVAADYRQAVLQGDEFVDMYLLCKRPYGDHGPTCLCGCRRIDPDTVYFCPFSKNENEPITWHMICPCCGD